MDREELITLETILKDVVDDAENLLISLEELVQTLDNEDTKERFSGWKVPVDALRNDAHRIACSLSTHIEIDEN